MQKGVELASVEPLLAIHCFTRAIGLNPKRAEAYEHRARALERVGNHDAAQDDVTKFLELKGETAAILRVRADIEHSRGQLKAAITTLDRVSELEPGDQYQLAHSAGLRESAGDFEGAERDLTRALELETMNINLWCYREQRARVREHLGDWDGALADYTAAIQISARNTFYESEPRFRRGRILFGRGDYKDAAADFRAAASQSRDQSMMAFFHIWLATALAGDRAHADKELAGALEVDADRLDSFTKLMADFFLGRVPESTFLERSSTSKPHNDSADQWRIPLVWFYAGMKRLLDADRDGAAAFLQKAVHNTPKHHPPTECLWAQHEFKRLQK